jgi:hypothetical protein
VAYVPKPTQNPDVAVQQEYDNGTNDSNSDTQMHDATAEEVKSSTRPSKNSQHTGVTKKVAWAEQNGTRMNDPAKGVNKTTKRHHGTAEHQQWQRKKQSLSCQILRNWDSRSKRHSKKLVVTVGLDPPKMRSNK